MKRTTIGLVAAMLVISLALEARAAVPQLINYQGRLTTAGGAPITGAANLIFTICGDSLCTQQLWTETQSGIMINDGLFDVRLGAINPIPASTFNGSLRWISISVEGQAGNRRMPLQSVPYSFRAGSADNADRALAGGGWYDDGTSIILETSSDKVGVGNADPDYKLDVSGSVRATDSLQTNKVVIGKSSTATGALNLYSSLTSLPIVQLFGSSTGGTVQVRDEAGNLSAYMKSSTGPGGLLSIARDAAGAAGFYVDGNNVGTEEPRVSVLGSSRSAIFDMSESGDASVSLPSSCISNTEMLNEAGIAVSRRTSGSVTLDNTVKTILSRSCSFPTSGYAIVIATFYYDFWHNSGTSEQFHFGVSDVEGSFPTHQGFYRNYSPNWTTFNYQDFVTIQGYFTVDAGAETFYLLGQGPTTGNPWVGDAHLTVLFFPTSYLAIKEQNYSNNPEQEQLDAMIQSRIDAETEKVRLEFDAKLQEIKAEFEKQLRLNETVEDK